MLNRRVANDFGANGGRYCYPIVTLNIGAFKLCQMQQACGKALRQQRSDMRLISGPTYDAYAVGFPCLRRWHEGSNSA